MKIKYSTYRGNVEFDTVKEAVKDALTPDVYSHEGQLEKLSAEIDKLQEMVASLIDNIYSLSNEKLRHEQLQDILGFGYEVEE